MRSHAMRRGCHVGSFNTSAGVCGKAVNSSGTSRIYRSTIELSRKQPKDAGKQSLKSPVPCLIQNNIYIFIISLVMKKEINARWADDCIMASFVLRQDNPY
ncbi:hypothetical protein EVAR_21581_1 [Eumeta japonica]|uniref:Uncharacterized protein n=1 Tax=Eumeta variegata TaxID=151549 RepID=A0A4C1UXB5_EUMVA|nr:hypothetical protein EVAR_21581_1 [Eumeta japonica]